jgi:hypothetical protein
VFINTQPDITDSGFAHDVAVVLERGMTVALADPKTRR